MNSEFINQFAFTFVYLAESVVMQENEKLVAKIDEYKIRKWHRKFAKGLALRHIILCNEKGHRYGECVKVTNPTELTVDSNIEGMYKKCGLKTKIIADSEDLQDSELQALMKEIQNLREETPAQTQQELKELFSQKS
jgi:hypothetical protein